MGVPAFFRWLSKKYPSIVVHCNEERPRVIDGCSVPVDNTKPNPNGVEFDNLYLDMNGIIHPCCHPEDKPAPTNEDEMMVDIFEYIDRLFSIVRPRRVLYMAIDGVAPRAKMNQQRSRRFRASKESKEKREEVHRLKDDMRSRGLEVPADKPERDHFDSNCITPGTEFMFRLADCLRYYVYHRLNNDPAWANIMVILSDANVPGEGEHKIMDFIRRQRAQPDHDPNTHHCLCGADADLIMLGLATHEPNFTIIREEFKPNKPRSCDICGQVGHEMKECTGAAKEKCGEFDELSAPVAAEQEFIFLRLNILREYLYSELTMTGLPFQQDLERAIDDWVLMCFFVGNDFLPHLPSLEIREGAIDRLIRLYKQAVYKTGGYLTENGSVNLARVQLILTELGEVEDEIFKKRRDTDLEFKRRDRERNKRQRRPDGQAPLWRTGGQYEPSPIGGSVSAIVNPRQTAFEMRQQAMRLSTPSSQDQSNRNAAAQLKAQLNDEERGVKRKSDAVLNEVEEDAEPADEVKLWEDGWKDRYYQSKFGVGPDDVKFRQTVGNAYVLGMCWVFKYYYQGCASWDWYFPYHYAPFASDFINIGDLPSTFEPGTKPFRPLEQLMSVFPAASGQFLPPSWQVLMNDPESPIIDFYPDDFRIDLNGKKYAWQGVALLPFVDEERLLDTLTDVYPHLTDYENQRNILGSDRLFVGNKHPARDFLLSIYEGELCSSSNPVEIDPSKTFGVRGQIWSDNAVVLPSNTFASSLPQCEDFVNNGCVSVHYLDPQFAVGYVFPVKMLENAKLPPRVLKPEDLKRNPGQQYRPQVGFSRDSGYRSTNPATANRFVRAGIGAYSHVAPPQRSGATQQGFGDRGYGPPMSWQRSNQAQASAYQHNQQQRHHQQSYGPPQGYGQSRSGYNPAPRSGYGLQSQGSGYGQSSGQYRNSSAIESYSTSRGSSRFPSDINQGGPRARQSYPYPPQRRY